MLFTLLTFPLRCTLDIEQCGRGPLFHGPFANEAIKSLLPRLWKGAEGWGGEASHLLPQQTPQHLSASSCTRNTQQALLLLSRPAPLLVVSSCQCGAQHRQRSQAASGHVYARRAEPQPVGAKRKKWKWDDV